MNMKIQLSIAALILAVSSGFVVAAKGDRPAREDKVAGEQALENSNRGDDKQKGLERSEERMSEQGLEHSKSREAHEKKDAKKKTTKKPKK